MVLQPWVALGILSLFGIILQKFLYHLVLNSVLVCTFVNITLIKFSMKLYNL